MEKRFIVMKNTLPYVRQWAVVDTNTAKRVGEFKTRQSAQRACDKYEQYGLPDKPLDSKPTFKSAIDASKERMDHPEDDPVPGPPRHSDNRPVELDE